MAHPSFLDVLANLARAQLAKRSEIIEQITDEHPTMQFLGFGKPKGGEGTQYEEPVILDDPQTVAATRQQVNLLTTTRAGAVQSKKWITPWVTLKGGITLDFDTIETTKYSSDSTVLIDTMKRHVKGANRTYGREIANQLWRAAGGTVVAATIHTSSGLVTLSNPSQIHLIHNEECFQAADGESPSDELLGSGSLGFVSTINQEAGTFYVSATSGGTAGTPDGWYNSGSTIYLMKYGITGVGDTAVEMLKGIPQWIPTSAPSATPFCNVVRTYNIAKLSGVRASSTLYSGVTSIAERVRIHSTQMAIFGFKMGKRAYFMNPNVANKLEREMRQNHIWTGSEKNPEFGFESIVYRDATGMKEFVLDADVPESGIWLLDRDGCSLRSFGQLPHVVDTDGQTWRKDVDTDDMGMCLTGKCGFIIPAPGTCGYIPLPT